ncbi:MAG: sarcosine oxidase subunit alpha family protein [Rhodospirillaceae bacterium]|nr:sarcosine oxidase subunit alpha family protein [Rhodospirillaceae bacterium]
MNGQPNRLPSGGRIDRSRPLRFTFNDRALTGFAGDTLASALVANGIMFVGRSFKYHRPRGIFSAGAEEPNALVQLGTGARTEPNLRATQVELYDGLTASSVNCWPSLELDIGALNSLAARLLPAGFYYKTFMWPPSLWRTYEHFIRKAAGLGRAPEAPDPDRYDKTYAHCDVLVAGGGPAGLAAALAAGRMGARVILVDEQPELGGALLSASGRGAAETVNGRPVLEWLAAAVAELALLPEVRVLTRTTAFGYYDHNFLLLVERVSDHLGPQEAASGLPLPRQRLWKVRARQVVLATGAIERPLVFADNDRPGVMLASAARTYVNRYAAAPGQRAVLFTNNAEAYRAAIDLADAGVSVAAVVDLRPEAADDRAAEARRRGIEILAGSAVTGTEGRRRLRRVRVMRLDGERVGGPERVLDCDLLAVSGGWNPAVHLFSQSRGTLRYDAVFGTFVPDRSVQAEHSAGACRGSFALADCLAEGFAAGRDAAVAAGFDAARAGPQPRAGEGRAPEPPRLVWVVPSVKPVGQGGKHFVDLQNDVTAADLLLANREGYRSVEHVKRYTTLGMGTDQGKTGNVAAIAILAGAQGAEPGRVGTTTFRPPYTPVTIGAFTGHDHGDLLEPIRKTPLHAWHESVGAAFENVGGGWRRAWYYPRPGESMHDAVSREVKAARTSVGIVDASTLGKIDIQGPDAVKLLNWVYTNAWDNLEIGRARYGLMCGEDGMVFDDGVTTRLGPDHYLMTTTTGNAARVLGWLEEWLQCEWTDYRVWCTSVTEEWVTVGLTGPLSRRLLAELTTDIDLDPATFPFMSFREGTVAGIPARVYRISFTGELSYEINVAPSYALALWQALMMAGEKYQITPYGTEAMHVLRAEKGYIIVGQDTDGTVTPYDLGMGWIVSRKKKDFLGKRSLSRPDTARPDRKHLVGLLTENPSEVLPEGGQIVAELKPRPPMAMIGHVTSSYWSPNLGRSIALALVKNGRNRMGETVHVPLVDRTIPAKVVEPRFFDPEGKRLHG